VAKPSLAGNRTAAELPYVERDIDRLARESLRRRGVLLVVGTPASGATRTAYQLALDDEVSRLVVAPVAPDGLRRAIEELDLLSRLPGRAPLVLWLDRIDRFCERGLSLQLLRELREHSPGLRVLATISSTRYVAWVSEERELADEFGLPVTLERLPSKAELERAKAAYPEVDFSEGIGAAFTVLPSLLRRLAGGDNECPYESNGADCTVARAVANIAIGWAGTGTSRDLRTDTLSRLACVFRAADW